MSDNEQPLRCGLVMPISAIDGYSEQHWEQVREIIREALSTTGFQVDLVSDANDVGVIQKRIVQNLYDNDIVVCDVSAKNPNVMFELGMRLAFDKPVVIIKDEVTQYSFDVGQIEHLGYPRDLRYHAIQTFKAKLREKVVATHEAAKSANHTSFLKHFGTFVVQKIEEKPVGTEAYLLETLSEIRGEVRSLRNVVIRQSTSGIRVKDSLRPRTHLWEPAEPRTMEKVLRDVGLPKPADFMADQINSGTIVAPECAESNSDAFLRVLQSYFALSPGLKVANSLRDYVSREMLAVGISYMESLG